MSAASTRDWSANPASNEQLNIFSVCEGGSEGPNWKIMPQTLRLRLDLCRAVKDSVPRGQYVMMASVWNRLGRKRAIPEDLHRQAHTKISTLWKLEVAFTIDGKTPLYQLRCHQGNHYCRALCFGTSAFRRPPGSVEVSQ